MSCEPNLIRVSFARKGTSEGVNVGGNDEMSVETMINVKSVIWQ